MSSATPQTIAADLLGRLELLFEDEQAPSQFVRRQLLREAEALNNADPATASLVKAAIAACSWDFLEAHRWINNALHLSNRVATMINAALTYRYLNRFDLACEMSEAAYKLAPLNGDVVNRTLSYLIWSGQLERALPLYQHARANKLVLADEIIDPGIYLQAMVHLGIPHQRLIFELAAAYRVLTHNNKRVRFLDMAIETDPESGAKSVLFGLGFLGSLDDEMRMESQLAQIFSDEPGWNPGALSVELQYRPEHADQFA